MDENKNMKMRCPLCGAEYERDSCRCQGCAMAKSCQMLCCPQCGYRTVDTDAATSARWLGKLLGRKEARG